MKHILFTFSALCALPLFAQQTPPNTKPSGPAAKPAASKPATPPRRELSEAERRALQDKRNEAEAAAMRQRIDEAARRAQAGQSEAARKAPPGGQPASNTPAAPKAEVLEENKSAINDAIKNKDAGAVTDIARDAIKEHGDEFKAVAEKLKEKQAKVKESAKAEADDGPLKATPLKPLTEPRVPRQRPAIEAGLVIRGDDLVMPAGAFSENQGPLTVAQRTFSSHGNSCIQTSAFRMESDKFEGVFSQGAKFGNDKKSRPGDPVGVSPAGGKQKEKPPLDAAVATGRVKVQTRDDKGETVIATGGRATYDPKTDTLILTENPHLIAGDNDQIIFTPERPDAVIIIPPNGAPTSEHCKITRRVIGQQASSPAGGTAASPSSAPTAPPANRPQPSNP